MKYTKEYLEELFDAEGDIPKEITSFIKNIVDGEEGLTTGLPLLSKVIEEYKDDKDKLIVAISVCTTIAMMETPNCDCPVCTARRNMRPDLLSDIINESTSSETSSMDFGMPIKMGTINLGDLDPNNPDDAEAIRDLIGDSIGEALTEDMKKGSDKGGCPPSGTVH